jgi:HTH-type transcriptional regulator, quorum sensing regulator NprR
VRVFTGNKIDSSSNGGVGMMNDAYEKIGQRVKAFRKERGFSQDELAEGICSRQTISLLENGQHFPSAEFMQKIAERLGVPFHEIMVDETSELEVKVQMDIIKVYIETRDFQNALELIDQLEQVEDVLEYQKREMVLCRAECLMQSGNAQGAIECLNELLQKLEQLREPDDIFMAKLYDKLGTANYHVSNFPKAYANYMRAYQLTLRFPKFDPLAAKVSYNLGMVCRVINNSTEAIEHLTRAESFFNSITDLGKLAYAAFELGIAYKDIKDYQKADQYLNEALVLYSSLNNIGMARRVKQTYALRVLSKQEPSKAIEELLKCAEGFLESGDTSRAALTYASAVEIILDDERTSEAERYINMALNLFRDADAKIHPRFAYVYQVYSKYLQKIKNLEKSIEYSYESSEIFATMGLDRDAADSLIIAAQVYREQGMFEKVDEVSRRIIDLLTVSQDRFTTPIWR